jgi:hypothetical protein
MLHADRVAQELEQEIGPGRIGEHGEALITTPWRAMLRCAPQSTDSGSPRKETDFQDFISKKTCQSRRFPTYRLGSAAAARVTYPIANLPNFSGTMKPLQLLGGLACLHFSGTTSRDACIHAALEQQEIRGA